MNNKGFGLVGLLAFICFIGIVLFAFYLFTTNFLGFIFNKDNKTPNYKNEYIIYMKEHNISLEK